MVSKPLDEEDIFKVACKIQSLEARNDYLKRACADHAALFDRVAVLLRMREEEPEFLESSPRGLAAMLDSSPIAEKPGSVIGPYKLLEQIGEGGFGVVFMAEQHQPLRRKVALKVLKPGMDTRQVVARFEAERQALALMDHPNIAHVFDGGETTSGRPYFVMELVRGIPVTDFCDQNHLPVRERLELFINVCQAVQHAHHKGVIHRDIKPSNIMVTMHDATPVAKVIDFGIAKATGQQLTDKTLFTNFAQMIGTPMYMSPEQAQMSGLDMDTRTDVYSLGVLLYELLTGTTPFDKERLGAAAYEEIRRMILEDEPAKPSTRISTLGMVASTVSANRGSDPKALSRLFRGELDWIVMKALEKDRKRRYETASSFAADVLRYLHDEPVQACPPSAGYRLRTFVRRHKGPVLAASLVALALVGGIIGTTWGLLRATDARADAVNAANQKETALTDKVAALAVAQQSERDAKGQLFQALLSQGQALRKSGEMGQRFESLKVLEEAVTIARSLGVLDQHTLALRNDAVACLALADLRVAEEWEDPARGDEYRWLSPVAFDAQLDRYVCSDQQGNIRLLETAGGREIARLPGPAAKVRDVSIQLSADGRFLAATYWGDGQPPRCALWELLEAGPALKVSPDDDARCCAFSADGRRFAVGQPDGSLALHDLAGGGQRSLGPDRHAAAMAFRPDGRQLAFTSHLYLTAVHILDLETNQVVRGLSHPDDVKALAWSADGRLLAAGCDDRNVHVWDTQEWKQQALLEGHQNWVLTVAFSPVGDLLASSALDGTTRLWDPISGRALVTAPGLCLQFSPDGRRLAFMRDSHLGVWDVADGRECRVLHHGRVGNRAPWLNYKGPEGLDFSADGRLLAAAAGDGVRLWDVASRQEVAFLNAGHHEAALFHPDGTRLFTFGRTGLRCWPVREDRGPGSLRVGPPELLGTPAVQGWFRGSRSADGRVIAAGDHLDDRRDRLFVFPADRPAERIVLGDDSKFARIALSPDGRWVAAGLHESFVGIKVWEARSGRLVWSQACGELYVTFSPDSAWLLGGGAAEYRLWKVGSWEPGPVIARDRRELWAGPAAFRADGQVLAVASSLQHVQLVDFTTHKEIATLAAPELPRIASWLCFSPDGGLLAVATEAHSIHVWDLGAIAERLQAMGLGCDMLSDSPARTSGRSVPRVRVFQDVYEAEHLPVVDSANAWPVVQDMKPFGREQWSNGKQLLCFTPKGGFVEVRIEVPETDRYALEVHLTRSPDFSIVEVAIDGQRLGPTFDGYNEQVRPSSPILFGTMELREGSHLLRFTAVDKNPKSTDHRMGIDCVKLTPEDGASGSAGRKAGTVPFP